MSNLNIEDFVKCMEKNGIPVSVEGGYTFKPIYSEDIGIVYGQLRPSNNDALLQVSKKANELPKDLKSRLEKVQKQTGIILRLYNNNGQNPQADSKTIKEYYKSVL